MKNLQTIKLIAVLFISSILLSSCSDDHHEDGHDHEEELITTVTYTLSNGSDVVMLKFQDLTGGSIDDATYEVSGPLNANTIYTGSVELLNETESPADNITMEVKAEGDEHEFFYLSSVIGVLISKTDTDVNGNPIGIETSLTTGNAGAGTLTIILKHEPTKPNNGVSDAAGGSTDAEVTFNITVQ
ncbi:type 1 periplasmic binding fold superfamily protein [Polaribacter sp. IC063]|uniref:type 1 periplasmic binding fold superfamily protein n=1 Tax=Polaribacter sp. IC063 TaxID=57031 RepID=UPI0011BFDD0F|nr:type 1 periplasmic binding fold superfamily protein [Polaribacter sp. IC063]TXD51700.1 type 1 periplasmic binding fold superfamily protein [Polaribacter sp. IC063]